MASVDFIYDSFRGISDGTTLDATTDWEGYAFSGAGVPTSDQHTDHCAGQVIDHSDVGSDFNLWVTDTLDDADQWGEIAIFADKGKYTLDDPDTAGSIILRSDTADPSDIDGYEVRFEKNSGDGSHNNWWEVTIYTLTASSRSTILSTTTVIDHYAGGGTTKIDGWSGGTRRIGASVVGTTITAYFDGEDVASVTDGTYSSGGYVGFGSERITSSTDAQPFWTEFRAWSANLSDPLYDGTAILKEQAWHSDDDATDCVLVLESTPAADSFLLVFAGGSVGTGTLSISDDGTGGWTLESFFDDPNESKVWSKVAAGDETTITVTSTGTDTDSEYGAHYFEFAEGWDVEYEEDGDSPSSGTLSSDEKIALHSTWAFANPSVHPVVSSPSDYRNFAYNAGLELENSSPSYYSLWGWYLGTATTAFSPTIGTYDGETGSTTVILGFSGATGATATPGSVDMPLATPAPTPAASSNATATPGVVDIPMATPAPAPSAGSDATATPAVVDLPMVAEAPAVSAAGGATVTPDNVDMPMVPEAPTIGAAQSATATPGVVDMGLGIGAPTIGAAQSATATPGVVDMPLVAQMPPQVGTPPPPSTDYPPTRFELGCASDYTVIITARDLETFAAQANFSSLSYSRVLDEISEATIDIPDVFGGLRCNIELGSNIIPWRFGVRIERNGQEVWSGPITSIQRPVIDGAGAEYVTIGAQDKMAWMTRRTSLNTINIDDDDAGDMFRLLIEEATSLDNLFGLYCPVFSAGYNLTRDVIPLDFEYIYDILDDLARSAVDWFMINGELAVQNQTTTGYPAGWYVIRNGAQEVLQPTSDPYGRYFFGLFGDEAYTKRPGYVIDGQSQANNVFVPGADSGEAGFRRYWSASDVNALDGILTYVDVNALYRPQEGTPISAEGTFQERADSLLALRKDAPVIISGGVLSQRAPVTMETMYPGSLWTIDLGDRGIDQLVTVQRLKRVDVQVQVTDDGIVEEVAPTLIPLGTDESEGG